MSPMATGMPFLSVYDVRVYYMVSLYVFCMRGGLSVFRPNKKNPHSPT